MKVNKYEFRPFNRFSSYHYEYKLSGILCHPIGITDEKNIYSEGCILAYHVNGYLYVAHQVTLNTMEIIRSKLLFQRESQKYGLLMNKYHKYNVSFNSEGSMKQFLKSQHKIYLSGTGTPQQNLVAEVAIKIVVNLSRTIMIHASLNSPKVTMKPKLLTMVIYHSVQLYNRTPNPQTVLAPIEVWYCSIFEPVSDIFPIIVSGYIQPM